MNMDYILDNKVGSMLNFLSTIIVLWLRRRVSLFLGRVERAKVLLYLQLAMVQQKETSRGFPGGAVVESLPANAGDTGSSPGLERSHMPRSN